MQRSIRWRLTTWYVLALAVTMAALGGAVFALMRASLYEWLDDSLRERAETLAARVHHAGGILRVDDLPGDDQRSDEAAGGILVLDRSRRVVTASGIDPLVFSGVTPVTDALDGRPASITVVWNGRWRVASYPVMESGRTIAVALVVRNLSELHQVLGRLALVLLGLVPLALAGAGLGGFIMAGRALKPVDEIATAAGAISERDLTQRLPVRTTDELGRLAETFNALIHRLEQAFERQRQFTANASHELRTPLAIIRAITSQKLMHPRSSDEYERALRQIDDSAGYMSKLVAHMLTLARADAGQAHLETELLDLSELLYHVTEQVGEAASRRIRVTTPGPIMVRGDPVRLTGLFLNLLENAAKFTPPEGTIHVDLTLQGMSVSVVVRDTGIGIPPEHLPHIFERFYRVDKARAREDGGTGLGLAIGQWVAEAHGGTIRADSQPGVETTITVTLPLSSEGRPG